MFAAEIIDAAPPAEPSPPPLVMLDEVIERVAQAFRSLTSEETTDALRASVHRAKVHAEHARAEGERGRAEYRAAGSPPLAIPSPREADLERATAPTPRRDLSEQHTAELRSLDNIARDIRRDLVKNPLWIAATHVERSVQLTKFGDLLSKDPELAQARDRYKRSEKMLVTTKKALDRHDAKPKWLRVIQDFILGTGDKLRDDFDRAANGLLETKQVTDRTETELRWKHETTAAEQNAAAHEKQKEACEVRDALEAPLRAALVERAIAQQIVVEGRPVGLLKDAPLQQHLNVSPTRHVGGFPVLEVCSPDGRIYLADAIEHRRALDVLSPVQGDRLVLTLDNGVREFTAISRGPNIALTKEPLEGRVGSVNWDGKKLSKFEITDAAGTSKWVVPRSGDDLMRELTGDVGQLLRPEASVRIQNQQVHVLGRANERGLGR